MSQRSIRETTGPSTSPPGRLMTTAGVQSAADENEVTLEVGDARAASLGRQFHVDSVVSAKDSKVLAGQPSGGRAHGGLEVDAL